MAGYARRFWWAIAAVLAGAGLITAVALWPTSSRGRSLPPTRARIYAAWRACLVTGPAGLSDPQAAYAWQGMEQASAKTSAKVSYQSVVGVDTVGNAEAFVSAAAGEQCGLVIAVGGPQVQGVAAVARRFPRTRFVVVDGGAAGANVVLIASGDSAAVTRSVASTVEGAIDAAPSDGA
jgi:basic membrane lipoprotein Med (substrate-binding protein (PBP1-ABC) superfamily)